MVFTYKARLTKMYLILVLKGILHIIYNDYGHKVAQEFLDNLQNIVTRFLVMTGFSVGISDLVADSNRG